MAGKLHFFNTLTRQLEEFEPLQPRKVGMYTCGPTVYNFVHIGNLRTFVFEDVLRRTLKAFGFAVTQVQNLTDIDDKTIRGAAAEGVSLREFTDRYAAAFFEDIAALGIEPAEHYPRATEFIPHMVEIIKKLRERGHTYELDGSTYYRISTFADYGKLSGIRPDEVLPGARVDADEYEKEDARDFVLWKAAKPGEPYWESELGPGRPGWHLECSAMSMHYLGPSFDIHAGGVDNIFPHHENEIAQSEGATGVVPFVRTWLHAEHLVVDGQKMAKSLGNFYTLRDLLELGHSPLPIRYLLLSVPYRQKLNFTFEGLKAAHSAVARIANTQRRLAAAPVASEGGDLGHEAIDAAQADFMAAIGDDLNTARALAALHTLLTRVNQALDGAGIGAGARARIEKFFTLVHDVLGIVPPSGSNASEEDAAIEALVAERVEARARRDFARADAIRAELAQRGIVVEDTPHGPVWHRKK